MQTNSSLPVWMRGASELGVSALIAVGMVWWVTARLESSQVRIERMLQIQAAFAYATCLNSARDELGMARCAVAVDGSLAQR